MDQEINPMITTKRRHSKTDMKYLSPIIKRIKEEDPELFKYRLRIADMESDTLPCIIGDIQEGYSPILLVCGRQRLGKTRFGLTLANIFSVFLYWEWFDYEKCFFLYPRKLLQQLKAYRIYVLDEAGSSGSGINKRQWWSELAELFDYILQTQGNLQNIYIFILPFASDLTTDIRKYVDYLFSGKKKGMFKAYKIYKREDQLVKNLKAFRQVWVEMLTFEKADLPDTIWNPVEKIVNDIKTKTREEKIKAILGKDDWLV